MEGKRGGKRKEKLLKNSKTLSGKGISAEKCPAGISAEDARQGLRCKLITGSEENHQIHLLEYVHKQHEFTYILLVLLCTP